MWLRLAAHSAVGVIAAYQAIFRMHGSNMQNQYYRAKRLPDLLQRRAAFARAFEISGSPLQKDQVLYRQLLDILAYQALGHASSALNDGQESVCEELCQFAAGLNPQIHRSKRWAIVQLKRHAGPGLCQALSRVKATMRQKMSRDVVQPDGAVTLSRDV
jgi:hypothetical protein